MKEKIKHVPERTCIVCRKKKAKRELNRLVAKEGEVVWDKLYRLPGRGAYVCKSADCIARLASLKNFERVFRKKGIKIREETIELMTEYKNRRNIN